jgi:hypothetical protein
MKAQAVISRGAIGMLPLPREQLWLYLSETAELRAGIHAPPRFDTPALVFSWPEPSYTLQDHVCPNS